MPRFAANLSMLWNELPFLDRFDAAARAGFQAVEFLFPYAHPAEEVRERLERSRLELALFNMPPGDWDAGERGIACHPGREKEFEAGVAKALTYARTLGCVRIHPMAGLRPPGASDADLRATYVGNLRLAARELANHGLTLVVEAINTRDMPGFYLNTSRQAFELLDEVGAANALFQADLYHLQITQGDLAYTLERNLARIGHIQIADNPGRHEPGTGEINYDFLLGHLDRIGYRGHVGCEYKPLTTTDAGLGWLARWRG